MYINHNHWPLKMSFKSIKNNFWIRTALKSIKCSIKELIENTYTLISVLIENQWKSLEFHNMNWMNNHMSRTFELHFILLVILHDRSSLLTNCMCVRVFFFFSSSFSNWFYFSLSLSLTIHLSQFNIFYVFVISMLHSHNIGWIFITDERSYT